MNVVVDTSVWSLVLRRRRIDEADPWVRTFRACVEDEWCIFLIGPILQELLDGVRTTRDFDRLLKIMTPFPLLPLKRKTYISAAKIRNDCRCRGIQASGIDFLIAAACIENSYPLVTADSDFLRIAKHASLIVVEPK